MIGKETEKVLIGIVFILVIVAVALTFLPKSKEVVPEEANMAKELFIKLAGTGYEQDDYYYSYTETFDDFPTTYTMLQKGDEKSISIDNMISSKQIYFLENETILCIQYVGIDACSSVKNNTDMESYLSSIEALFFDDSRIESTISDMEYFEQYGYILFSPQTIEKTVNGHSCTEFSYQFDFTNLTIYEAARFGIGSNTPKTFLWTACVDNESGNVYEKHVEYNYSGRLYQTDVTLNSAEWNTVRNVEPPMELFGDAVSLLIEEKTSQNTLVGCFEEKGEEKDRCIAMVALSLKNRDVCELAGERRDRCLVSIVPLTKDATICPAITDASFKDDCYIEMGGATGDESYCTPIVDAEKKEFCMNVSAQYEEPSVPEIPEVPGNDTNTTGNDSDVADFVWDLYREGLENDTNVTE